MLKIPKAKCHISSLSARNVAGIIKVEACELGNDAANELVTACGTHIVNSRNGPYSVVSTANDQSNPVPVSGVLEFHTDGLYCDRVPDQVLLYCENAGEHESDTVLADTRIVVERLKRQGLLEVYRQLQMVYDFGDQQSVLIPIINDHPLTDEPIVHLGANGYVRSQLSSEGNHCRWSFPDVVELMQQLYRLLNEATVLEHTWRTGELLMFDNHSFVHRRRDSTIDHGRKLIRIWLAADVGPGTGQRG